MKGVWKFLSEREPAATASAIMAVVNVLVLLGWFSPTETQLAGLNTALITVLGYAVRRQVTAPANLPAPKP